MISIIKKPIVTEKAMRNNEKGQYVFSVDPNANKIEIKKAIEQLFEVNVISIRTANIKGKVRTRFTKKGLMHGTTPKVKKAFITLKEGQSIDLVTGASS